MTRPAAVAAFIDLTAIGAPARSAHLAALARPDGIGGVASRAIVYGAAASDELPCGWTAAADVPDETALGWAVEAAVAEDLPLLVAAAGAMPAAETIAGMVQALALDPLFGGALPRLADPDGALLLPDLFGPGPDTAPLRILSCLPEYQVLSERVTPCMLLRRELVSNLLLAPSAGQNMWEALAEYMVRARRAGFRPVLCNRLVVPLYAATAWGCTKDELARLQRLYAEAARPPASRSRLAERLLAAAFESPRSLVIDARNLTPTFNGTSAAIIGACNAMYGRECESPVTLWLHPDAASWHRVADRYSGWNIATAKPRTAHAAALRLSQPWHPSDLDALRDLAAVNVFWFLDNIAWDIGYAAPPELDATWQRVAMDADALLFISDFSRQRFCRRFTVDANVRVGSCLLSLSPSDYDLPIDEGGPGPPYWLIVGNRYDHKHVGATVDVLARAFPSQPLVVFGDRDQPRAPHITRFASGRIDDTTVRACFARADLIVFPSFYEGFGLPIVEGLAYGRTVVARESALVHELASRYHGPGRLVVYTSERELVDVLSRLGRGEAPAAVRFGGSAGNVWDWDAAAACLLKVVAEVVARAPSTQMLRRTGLSRGFNQPVA